MNTYIAILRGINVSGRNVIKMTALREAITDAGFSNVTTYIQSGNLVFQYTRTTEKKIAQTITKTIIKHFDLTVPAIVVSRDTLIHIVDQHPFLDKCKNDLTKIHITLLTDNPGSLSKKIPHEQFLPDEFRIIDNVVYLYCPGGYGNTRLNNTFFEKQLNTTATTRNMKTMLELVKLSGIVSERNN